MKANKTGFANDEPTSSLIVGFCVARAIAAVVLVSVIIASAPAEATRDAGGAAQAGAPMSLSRGALG